MFESQAHKQLPSLLLEGLYSEPGHKAERRTTLIPTTITPKYCSKINMLHCLDVTEEACPGVTKKGRITKQISIVLNSKDNNDNVYLQ